MLGSCFMVIVRKIVDNNICLFLNGYGDRAVLFYKYNTLWNNEININYCWFCYDFSLIFKRPVCYTEMTSSLQFTTRVQKSHSQYAIFAHELQGALTLRVGGGSWILHIADRHIIQRQDPYWVNNKTIC